MYIFCIILILIASVLIILSVLAQSPKSGMAANFGASNQVMGVRQTADFLERFTWGLAVSIVVLSLAATMSMPRENINTSKSNLERSIEQSVEGNQSFGPLGFPAMDAPDAAPAEPAAPATEPEN